MSTITKDLGVVTAYGYAVSKGYTGTEEEFAELMASYATVAESAAQSATTATEKAEHVARAVLDAVAAKEAAQAAQSAAQSAKTSAESAASSASTSATNAASSASTASTAASTASTAASTASTKASEAAASATSASGSATTAQAAQTAAEAAQSKAEDAQEAAEQAAEELSAEVAQIETNKNDIANLKSDLADLNDAIERTIGTDLAENLFPSSLKNNGVDITATNCNASISGDEFSFTATKNTELIFGAVATTTGTSYADHMGPKIPIAEGEVVNVSLAPTFTKNFVTFFGADNKSLSWQQKLTNIFTISAPAGTEYCVLRIGVPTVTTGNIYTTRIIALKPYESVVDSTASKTTQFAVFDEDLLTALDFAVGETHNGAFNPKVKYRVSTRAVCSFDKPLRVTVPVGKAVGYTVLDASGAYVKWVGWFQTPGEIFTIPENTFFRLTTRREPQDTSEVITDTKAFVSDFTFEIVSNISTLADRVSLIENSRLPDYYYSNNWLGSKIAEIHDSSAFLNGVTFPFITDLHFTFNAKNSKLLLKEVLDKTSCSIVIGGGDYAVMYGTEEQLDSEYQDLLDYAGLLGHNKWFSMLGNHDFFNAVSSSDQTRHSYTWGKTYNGVFRSSERWQIKSVADGGYFCIDNEAQKTRMIILNSSEPTNATSDYIIIGAARVKNAQLQWLYDRITELSGYRIIVFSHIPSDQNMHGFNDAMAPVQTILEAFANKTTFSVRGTDNNDNVTGTFSASTNELICHISGHSHLDDSHVSNGVLSISTTCDAHYQDDGHGAAIGTVTEQAFDVFCIDYDAKTINAIRIGRGSNRNWTY